MSRGVALPTLYLLRHGETENNVEGRITGQRDSSLTAKGREQAATNGRLLRTIVQDLGIVDFVSSPLGRAQDTMRIARSAAGLDPDAFETDARLVEANFGDWTGLIKDEMFRQRTKDATYDLDPWHFRMPNGESRADVHARVASFLGTLRRGTVIVGHAGSVVMVRGIRLSLSRDAIMRLEPRNAGIVVIEGDRETAFGT
jgi:probable phosphoglycerate mutase